MKSSTIKAQRAATDIVTREAWVLKKFLFSLFSNLSIPISDKHNDTVLTESRVKGEETYENDFEEISEDF
jgi:hypothetical protein